MSGIAIASYGIGNIASIVNAFRLAGHEVAVAETPAELNGADRIVVPGVGAFGQVMDRLEESGFADALRERVATQDVAILGICVGMQALVTEGTEFGIRAGLGFIPGRVEIIPRTTNDLRLPQVGWNELEPVGGGVLLDGVKPGDAVYFVNSYHVRTDDPAHVAARTDYGGQVTAVIAKDRIYGVQFHPEKSQKVGLQILKNFAERA